MHPRGLVVIIVANALQGVAFADEACDADAACDSTTGDALFQSKSRTVLSAESMSAFRNMMPTSNNPQVLELLARATDVLGSQVTPEVKETIDKLIKVIEDSLEAKLKRDQEATQNDINAKIKEIKDSTATAVTYHESATASDGAWLGCVAAEKVLVEESEAANVALATAKEDMDGKCAASTGSKTWSATVPANRATLRCDFTQGNCGTEYGEFKTKLKEWYDSLEATIAVMKSEYDTKKTACEESTNGHVEKTGLASDTTNKWKDERAKCEELQTAREVGMCVFGEKLQDKCKAKADYEKLISDIDAESGPLSVKERENEWASMELLKCMLKKHKSDSAFDEATMQACRTNDTFTAEVGTLDKKAGELEGLAYTCTESTITFNGKTCSVPEVTETTSFGYNCDTEFHPAVDFALASPAFSFCAVPAAGPTDVPDAPQALKVEKERVEAEAAEVSEVERLRLEAEAAEAAEVERLRLEAPYKRLVYPDITCPEHYTEITTIEGCQQAASGLGLTYDATLDEDGNFIDGCIEHQYSNGDVYYNKRPGATRGTLGGHRICKV